MHWRVKGICSPHCPKESLSWEKALCGFSSNSPIWSHGASSPVLFWSIEDYTRDGWGALLYSCTSGEATSFHLKLRWFLGKRRIYHDTIKEIDVRLALDKRNSHWLKFKWKAESHLIKSACFENERTDTLRNDMGITQISYLLVYDSVSENTIHRHRKLYLAEPRCTEIHKTVKKSGTTFLTKRNHYLYTEFKQKTPNPAEVAHFSASRGWFWWFHIWRFPKPSAIRQSHRYRWESHKRMSSKNWNWIRR